VAELLGFGLTRASRPEAKLLTKGDNNAADDTELYARGQDYLNRKDIVG
jgi:signal peptidase